MTDSQLPQHFVVDGSNIATEGRSLPSLSQLNDAVLAFMKQYPDRVITVVVDATFGHRIDKSESAAFDEAVANNELVSPPAGAVGRGDAFVLSIADQANAGVLSNDSFQEFHGQYEWLFDVGRLIGGKPVPNVGWVFVERTPVRGPKSRESMKRSKSKAASPSDLRNEKRKAASRIRRKDDDGPARETSKRDGQSDSGSAESPSSPSPTNEARSGTRSRRGSRKQATVSTANYVNELLPFLEFVEHRRIGDEFTATVDRYASHGAYLIDGDVALYLPLNYMGDPAPTSARSAVALGDEVSVVLVGYQPDRRSIDVALPGAAATVIGERTGVGGAASDDTADASAAPSDGDTAEALTMKQDSAKRTSANKASAKKTTATEAPVKKTAAKKTAAKKTAAKKTAAKKTAAKPSATKATPAKKTPAKKSPAKKTPAKKSPAKKSPAKKAPAKKSADKQAAAKKVATKKTSAVKTTAKKAPAKKSASKKTG